MKSTQTSNSPILSQIASPAAFWRGVGTCGLLLLGQGGVQATATKAARGRPQGELDLHELPCSQLSQRYSEHLDDTREKLRGLEAPGKACLDERRAAAVQQQQQDLFGAAAALSSTMAVSALYRCDTRLRVLPTLPVPPPVCAAAGAHLCPPVLFAWRSQFAVPDSAGLVATGDLQGDGKRDVALFGVANVVSAGRGDGHLGPLREFARESAMSGLLADVDGDGRDEVVTSDSMQLRTYAGGGKGRALRLTSQLEAGPGARFSRLLAGNFTGGATPDVLATDVGAAALHLLRNDGRGNFTPQRQSLAAPAAGTLLPGVTGDFDGDGHLDAAEAALDGHLRVLFGRGDGRFGTHIIRLPTPLADVKAGDLDGDGKTDLALALKSTDAQEASVQIYLGASAAGFVRGIHLPGDVAALTLGDFNRDGRLDLLSGSSQHSGLTFYAGRGDGSFAAGEALSAPVSGHTKALHTVAFGGENSADLVFMGLDGGKYRLATAVNLPLTATCEAAT